MQTPKQVLDTYFLDIRNYLLEIGAMFDPPGNTIYVKRGMEAQDIFRSVSLELAHAELADGDGGYSRHDNMFRAYCASYMLCVRNGVEVNERYLFHNLPEYVANMDAKALKGELSAIRGAAGNISERMAKVLGRKREAPREARG